MGAGLNRDEREAVTNSAAGKSKSADRLEGLEVIRGFVQWELAPPINGGRGNKSLQLTAWVQCVEDESVRGTAA